jgi:TrpR-related protein YerC/YecD
MAHLQQTQTEGIDQLFQAMLSLENIDECRAFFSDLFTRQELSAFAQRLQVAKLLLEGNTYEMVRAQVPVSSSTITRINTELRYGSGGYHMVLERLEQAAAPDTSRR